MTSNRPRLTDYVEMPPTMYYSLLMFHSSVSMVRRYPVVTLATVAGFLFFTFWPGGNFIAGMIWLVTYGGSASLYNYCIARRSAPKSLFVKRSKPELEDDYAGMPEPGSLEWESWIDARIRRQDDVSNMDTMIVTTPIATLLSRDAVTWFDPAASVKCITCQRIISSAVEAHLQRHELKS